MQLTKTSSEVEIKQYFEKVLELAESGKEFCVDFGKVWSLVYTREDNAKRDLKENFLQDVDYQFSLKNEEKSKRGRPKKYIMLTVGCLEYFIAKKRKEVFEVYRKVFHKYMKIASMSYSDYLRQLADTIEQKEKNQRLLAAAKDENEKLRSEIDQIIDSLVKDNRSLLIREFVQALSTDDFMMSANRTYQWFREKGYLTLKETPTSEIFKKGYMEFKQARIKGNGEAIKGRFTPHVHPRGIMPLYRLIKKDPQMIIHSEELKAKYRSKKADASQTIIEFDD